MGLMDALTVPSIRLRFAAQRFARHECFFKQLSQNFLSRARLRL
jgi:hypothetical protein